MISGAGSPNYLGGATGLAVSGNDAYVAAATDDAVTIIDISSPASPTFVGTISGAGSPNYLNNPVGILIAQS